MNLKFILYELMVHIDQNSFSEFVPELQSEELITRTFLRLDPERQQAILDALFEEAAEKGPDRLNIKQIAERSGASIGSLYQYFGSREKILQFAIHIAVKSLTELFRLCGVALQDRPARIALKEYLEEGIRLCQSQKSLTRFLTLAAYQGDDAIAEQVVKPIAIAMHQAVHSILARAQERGELRADIDLEAASRAINALLILLGDSQLLPNLNIYWQISDESMSFSRVTDTALEMIFSGIGRAGVA